MEELLSKHKVALEALFVVEGYVSELKNIKRGDSRELLKAERKTREALNQSSLPRDVRQAIDRVISSVLESYIVAKELLAAENKRQEEKTRRRRTEYFIVLLYILTMFAAFWVRDWRFVLVCFPISFVEYRLLNDALPFRVWGAFFAKRKTLDGK